MNSEPAPVQRTLQRFLLAVLTAWAVASFCVSASFLWTPQGTVGITSNYGGTITSVAPNSSASRAGIAPGDTIVLDRTPFESRPKVVGFTTPVAPGTRIPVAIRHDGVVRDVVLTADVPSGSRLNRLSYLLTLASTAVFVIVGAGLILLRPSLVTWGFGLFCLFTNPVIPALSRFPSASAHLVYVLIYDVVQNIGIVGLLVFALNFPLTARRLWRRTLVRMLWPLFLVLAGVTSWIDLAVCAFAVPAHDINIALQVAFGLVDALCIYLLTETYVTGPVDMRPRMRWILVGFYVGLAGYYTGSVLIYTANVTLPAWLDTMLVATAVTLPLTVAYGVIRHRVIDVDFFLSRAFVYAIFTTVLVVLFALSDWLFGHILEDFRFSLFVDAMISIGAALVFDNSQKFVERAVDRVLFSDRRIARERLKRAAQALRFVQTPATVDETIIDETHASLDVQTVALFRNDGVHYRRVASIGWNSGDAAYIDKDDRLIRQHLAEDGVLHLSDIPWSRSDTPHGLLSPVLSVPLRSGNSLDAVLLCSLKPHGEQLDPEALDWLIDFAKAAGAAYAELNTQRLRDDANQLRTQVAILDARLEEIRRTIEPRPSSTEIPGVQS